MKKLGVKLCISVYGLFLDYDIIMQSVVTLFFKQLQYSLITQNENIYLVI